jgi:ribonuclease G
MRDQEHRTILYNRMKAEMDGDRSKYTILPLSKFGLMQITRQRVRPQMNIVTLEVCPTCGGTGKINASILVTDQIEQNLEYLITKQNETGLTLEVHPFLHAFFTKGIFSQRFKWFLKYKTWVKIEKNTALGLVDYRFRNSQDEEININGKSSKKELIVDEDEVYQTVE